MTARDALAPILYDLAPERSHLAAWEDRGEHVRDYWRLIADRLIAGVRAFNQADAEDLVGGTLSRPPQVTGSIWGVRLRPGGPVRVMPDETRARAYVASPTGGGTLVRFAAHEWQEVPL